MFNKKVFLGLLAFAMLPMVAVNASAMMDDENDSDLIYLRVGYQATAVGEQKIDLAKEVTVVGTTPTVTTNDYKPKYAVNFMGGSLGIGKSFTTEARAELEIAANSQMEIDNSAQFDYFDNIATPAAFTNRGFKFGVAAVNLYYDIDSGRPGFTPYIGGGIGLARVNFLSAPTSETITYPVALQFKAGLQMKFNNMMPVYLGYKLVYLVQKEAGDTITSMYPTPNPAGSPPVAALTTKVKSSYTLHNFDIGIMLVK